jgi:hypothetical protein
MAFCSEPTINDELLRSNRSGAGMAGSVCGISG